MEYVAQDPQTVSWIEVNDEVEGILSGLTLFRPGTKQYDQALKGLRCHRDLIKRLAVHEIDALDEV